MKKYFLGGLVGILTMMVCNAIIVIFMNKVEGFWLLISGLIGYYFGRKVFHYYKKQENKIG